MTRAAARKPTAGKIAALLRATTVQVWQANLPAPFFDLPPTSSNETDAERQKQN
jgi:hypothetical protein